MSRLHPTPSHAGTSIDADVESRRSSQDWCPPKMEESASTTTAATTSSSCASPQTDSSSVGVSPATESSNQKFRFHVKDNSVSAIEEALKTEKEFIEYVMTLPATRMDREIEKSFQNQSNKNNSLRLSDGNRKVGLDHLNSLCKLMEQLSELRESNVKLKRRIQFLEDSKVHRDYVFPLMTKDDMAIVATRSSNDMYKSHTLATMSHIQKDNRERSKSTDTSELSYTKIKRKFPKWSKWKEAFGLDRSSQIELKRHKDNRNKASNGQCCGELELPLYNNDQGRNEISPARSLPDRNWCSATFQSSSDDVMGLSYENSEQNTSWEQVGHPALLCLSESEFQDQQNRRRKSSAGIPDGNLVKGQIKKSTIPEQSELQEQLIEKFDKDDLKKSIKTPWGRVKTIIQTRRDSVKQTKVKCPHRNNSRSAKREDQSLDAEHLEQDKEIDRNSEESNKKSEDKQTERKASQEQVRKSPAKDGYSRSVSNDEDGSSGQVSNLVRELQRNLSEDFNKKLEEWEKIKAKSSTSKSDRKDSNPKRIKSKKFERGEKSFRQRVKDINWLEKELQKVQAETQRLSKEKQKCEKRALRLERLKEAIMNGTNKKEVFVKTSAGEFRFEGISDAFTKKLYEWETKQGVRPELSTIALLDSCLMSKSQTNERAPLKKGHSRSDSSLADASQTSPTSSPSFKHPSNNKSTKPQLSRSNTEPDLLYSGQKETVEQHTSSYSTDMLCSEVSNFHRQESETTDGRRETVSSENNNYYSLLEDNMYLLEKLRNKEEICRRLQGELDTLDDKTVLMAKKHQDEMERYREKLWEIHRPGRKPRDLQSSLKLISCLKTRIEELQRCSEKLKQDRETLEDSFRYHSEQQARLADGLAEKMKELQEAGWSSASGADSEDRRRRYQKISCDVEVVEKLADLSTQLLQQAREVDKTLAERSRQVCHLRWELLHRDVSMMLLQTEVHRSKWQNVAAGDRRAKFRQKRSWSSSERLYPKERDDGDAEEWLQSRLKSLSTTTYNDWPKVDYGPSELVWTIHEMKKAILKLSASDAEQPMERNQEDQEVLCREESEVADSEKYDLGSVVHSRSSSFSSEMSSHLCSSRPDSRLYDNGRVCGQRRNSLGNLSSMSGADISDSSSVNEPEKTAPSLLRLPWKTWRSKDNVSTSSDSSLMDDDSLTTSWYHARRYELSGDEKYSDDDLWSRELNIQFTSLNEEDEESPIAVLQDSRLHINAASSPSSSEKSNLSTEQAIATEMESSNNKPVNNTNRYQQAAHKPSGASNEIVIDKLTDTGSVRSLKVRMSSSSDLLDPKSSTSTSSSPVSSSPKNTASEPTTDCLTKVCNDVSKVGPILPTYAQCLNVSAAASSHELNSETSNIEKTFLRASSNSGSNTCRTAPNVTVATQKVKLSYFNESTSKVTQIPGDISTCNDTRKGVATEQTGGIQLNCIRTEFLRQTSTTSTGRDSTEERAECSNTISNTCNVSNDQRSLRISELSKVCRDSLADTAFCGRSILNSQAVKSIGNSSPSQSSTASSPEADLSAKPKTGWLPLSIFRQK